MAECPSPTLTNPALRDAALNSELFACAAPSVFNASAYRADFPLLRRNPDLVYLDTAASAQKPKTCLDAMQRFYENDYANINRGVHKLSQRATDAYEAARRRVQRFISAKHTHEIIFVRGATEAINLVAQSWGSTNLKAGDEIILSTLEHHANIVPWVALAKRLGAKIIVAPINSDGQITLDAIKAAISPRTKLIAVSHISNALGTIAPIAEICAHAQQHGIITLIDGCQAACHLPLDMQSLGADFYVFSGHKLYGPTGIGVLYGKAELLAKMPPYQTGGDMIATVAFDNITYRDAPHRFEAGTPAIAEAIGLAASIDYIATIGLARIAAHESALLAYAQQQCGNIAGLNFIGKSETGILSFTMANAHPHDIGTILDDAHICIRAGHHCAQPLMTHLGLPATARASFGLYTTTSDIDALASGLHKVQELFGR